MNETHTPPQVGDVWRDLDPRGGPTFRVVEVGAAGGSLPRRVTVEGLDGKRRRRILIDRFRESANHRSGYTLISRENP
jgi:hypothetical protein